MPKKAKEEKPKKVKVDTKAETLKMYREGMSVKDIAAARSLTSGTIESHLAHYVGTGELNINDFVSTSHQVIIRGVIKSFGIKAHTISDIKNALPPDYTYAEIKMVEQVIGSKK